MSIARSCQMLDVEDLGELPARAGDVEALELPLAWLPRLRAIHQEEDAPGIGILDEPVGTVAAVYVLPAPVAI